MIHRLPPPHPTEYHRQGRSRAWDCRLAPMSSPPKNVPHTIAMRFFLLFTAAVAFAQSPDGQHDNYYSVNRDSQVGERLATELQANIAAVPEPRLDRIGGPSRRAEPAVQVSLLRFRWRPALH